MAVSSFQSSDPSKLTVGKSSEEEHVLCFGVLPFQVQGDGTSGKSSWKPVKDLVRSCMPRTAGDEPGVTICDGYQDKFQPWAIVRLKREENARRVFDRIAGNTWYGAVLVVVWLLCPSQLSENRSVRLLRIGSELDRPETLEHHSQIRDKKLLRRHSSAYHEQSTESLSTQAMRIVSNFTSPSANTYGYPIYAQPPIPTLAHHDTSLQTWSSTNQVYQNHNNMILGQAPAQWITPNSSVYPTMNSAQPIATTNMAAPGYPMVRMVMLPIAHVSEDTGYCGIDHSRNTSFASSQSLSSTGTDNSGSASRTSMTTHAKSPDKAAAATAARAPSEKKSTVRSNAYTPPVIVDGSKSARLI